MSAQGAAPLSAGESRTCPTSKQNPAPAISTVPVVAPVVQTAAVPKQAGAPLFSQSEEVKRRRCGNRNNKGLRKNKGSGNKQNDGDGHDQRLSRSLSKLLRHKALEAGLEVGTNGFVSLNAVRALPQFQKYSLQQIRAVVADNDKQRFSLMCADGSAIPEFASAEEEEADAAGWLIRANQGHSLAGIISEELLQPVDLAQIEVCVHGTHLSAWEQIKTQGLRRMGRQHVHFAAGLPGESGVISGMRIGTKVLVYLNCAAAKAAGLEVFQSANGVLLSRGFVVDDIDGVIPPCFFEKVVNRETCETLFVGDSSEVLGKTQWVHATDTGS